jgi:hypothetical protein
MEARLARKSGATTGGGRTVKALLAPVYFKSRMDDDYRKQLARLRELLREEAQILDPLPLGARLPAADAVVFPQLLGDAFKQIEQLKKIRIPFLALTSEFGTVNMWDWEIVSFLQTEGLTTFAPYNLELTRKLCRSLAVKRELSSTRFLVYQDNPGEGMQAEIFKRFYWWEERCAGLMKRRFGVTVVKKSFKAMAAQAKEVPDAEAETAWKSWNWPTEAVSPRALNSALKIYLTVKKDVEADPDIRGVGINCLNESFYSDTTPCLAWNLLFEEKGLLWACEADTMSLLSKVLIHRALDAPIMMSNIYPFLMGLAALKHERIDAFPEVQDPENYLLIVHCGYFGIVPRRFSTEWTLRPKVLKIVDDNATAIDARLATGPITLSKLDPTMTRLQVIEGTLEGYVQYPGSDCRNGALIHVQNGHRLMESFYSHHNLLIPGHRGVELKLMARALGLQFAPV